jgi:hypothetical protein
VAPRRMKVAVRCLRRISASRVQCCTFQESLCKTVYARIPGRSSVCTSCRRDRGTEPTDGPVCGASGEVPDTVAGHVLWRKTKNSSTSTATEEAWTAASIGRRRRHSRDVTAWSFHRDGRDGLPRRVVHAGQPYRFTRPSPTMLLGNYQGGIMKCRASRSLA